jgi:hypothetical protein
MQNTAWVALLRLVPPDLHDSLVVVTTAGQEIVVQSLFRMEEEYLVIRGRMAGTSDTGRILFIPYDHINYLGFQKLLKEPELTAIYEGAYAAAPAAEDGEDGPSAEEAAAPLAVELPPPPAAPPTPVPPRPAAPAPHKSTKQASKTVLLERVRARLAAQAKASKPSTSG